MNVYIANFGRRNYEWAACRERNTIATMNEAKAHEYWRSRDRESYIHHLMQTKTWAGIHPTRSLASRWFNLMDIIINSKDDYWVHREGPHIWWTRSLDALETYESKAEPVGDGRPVVVCHKPCTPWSSRDTKGRTLEWDALHVKAKEFLSTESTLQKLSDDNAAFAVALIRGDDLSPWHERAQWKARIESTKNKRSPVTSFTPQQKAAWRMVDTAINTVNLSNGQEAITRIKNKNMSFGSLDEFRSYVEALIEMQEGLCAISELKLQYDGDYEDAELLCSLDRIDSNGHYEPGNLQVVCKFINRWKSAEDDARFRRLVQLIRN